MLTHIEQKHLPYSPQEMFDLVVAVDLYHEFAPWCVASRINTRESDKIFYADLVVGYKMIRERFSSKVIAEPPQNNESGDIYIEYLKGPLQHLKNRWRFTKAENNSCIIDFSVEFEFKNKALQGLSQVFFREVISRMVAAFEERAADIYGERSLPSQ